MKAHDVEPGSHVVHFYVDDQKLAASIADYAAEGLDDGVPFVLIAEPAHRTAVQDALVARGVDMERSPDAGVHVLDASAALGAFMHGSVPDPGRFDAVVGGALRAASAGRPGVRAYGEMVEVLWSGGDVAGALALEELWNRTAAELPLSLYCAYRDSLFTDASDDALDTACRLHSTIVADGALARRTSESAHFSIDDGAPAAARAFVDEVLANGAAAGDGELLDNAALVTSELATNAVRYGGGSTFSVTVSHLADAVRIAVRDSSTAMATPRLSSPEDLAGRGMRIVAALSRDWGTSPRRGGKVVWAELACA